MKIKIRQTNSHDLDEIISIHEIAFGEDSVAKLTAELIKDETAEPIVSLIALDNDIKPIGHILFSNCSIDGILLCPLMHILAPLAVIPKYQNKGIGGKLIKEGIQQLKQMNSQLVFVLGHIDYYPKHGFINNAEKLGYPAPYPIPSEVADAWMVRPINKNGQLKYKGKVVCAEALDSPEHWRE